MVAITTDARFIARERRWLEGLHRRYHRPELVHPDPLEVLADYPDVRDREIAALVAACLAYGNVKAMLPAIATVLETIGPSPTRWLRRTSRRAIMRRFPNYRYRFTTGRQMGGLLAAMKTVTTRSGSLEACFTAGVRPEHRTVLPAIGTFVDTLTRAAPCPLPHLLPHPDGGSACKRLNMFLRWMVRSDVIDPGGWADVDASRLVMPLDTHVHRTALERGWTERRTPNLRTAEEVTAMLAAVCPEDPLRYDFAITRPGIRGPA